MAGYPQWLFRRVGHPVSWAGWLIAWLDRVLNRPPHRRRRTAGIVAVLVLLACAVPPAWAVARWGGPVVACVLMSTLLAQRSLWQHVRAVESALAAGLPEARAAVAHIVGRDVAVLDEAGVVRAAIESLAESFSDGVVAPGLWAALAGLPGIAGFKAVSTADSVIGHRSERYEAFGWAAARLDDVLNLPAARLSALLIALAAALHGADAGGALRAAWRDARLHPSPNAGWPEAAMAGALGLRLGGPRSYAGVAEGGAWLGAGRTEATRLDLVRALRLYRTACVLGGACVAALLAAAL